MNEKVINIERFLNEEGQIVQLSMKRNYRLATLSYLATKFEDNCYYSEQEVNEICGKWHTFNDYFLLRRELVDFGLLDRKRDGTKYWKANTKGE